MTNNTQMYIDLGEVICAKKMFLHLRSKSKKEIKAAKSKYDYSTKEYNDFGMYNDCGDSYSEWNRIAKNELKTAIDNRVKFVVSSEKFFKKLKHKFIEKYPDFEWLLFESLNKSVEGSNTKH